MSRVLVLLLAFCGFGVLAVGDAEKGATLFKKCVSCHGRDGYGIKSQKAPLIAGQHDWYLVTQIKNIRDEVRSNKNTKKMYPFVKKLTDQDIEDLAAYISSMQKIQ